MSEAAICLKPINDLLNESFYVPAYQRGYATRPKSAAFLDSIDTTRREENIDYYHICNAYEEIHHWFEQRGGGHKLTLLQCLTNEDSIGRNVKVIWYELPDKDDAVEAFTRLNVGKIPLTNAELFPNRDIVVPLIRQLGRAGSVAMLRVRCPALSGRRRILRYHPGLRRVRLTLGSNLPSRWDGRDDGRDRGPLCGER